MEGTIVENVSLDQDIFVALDHANAVCSSSCTPPKDLERTLVKAGETINVHQAVDGGCAKLFIWSGEAIVWCGVVPVGTSQPISINPDWPMVMFDDAEVPYCPKVLEHFSGTSFGDNDWGWLWIVGVILMILLVIYLLSRKHT